MALKEAEWEIVKKKYETGIMSLRAIADQHDIHHSSIIKKAKSKSWTRVAKRSTVTKKVTKEITIPIDGEKVESNTAQVDELFDSLKGKWAKLFFEVVRNEMQDKYFTYDYFSLTIAAMHYQDMMTGRKYIPKGGVSTSTKGTVYVSGEYNYFLSASNNFMKVVKDLGLSPTSRARASLKIVEKIGEQTIMDLEETNESEKIEI